MRYKTGTWQLLSGIRFLCISNGNLIAPIRQTRTQKLPSMAIQTQTPTQIMRVDFSWLTCYMLYAVDKKVGKTNKESSEKVMSVISTGA